MAGYIGYIRGFVGHRPIIYCGAAVIVADGAGRILLQRRVDDGHWGLPGGGMEMGEALEDTARRELLEETGLQAISIELMHVFSGPGLHHTYPNGDEVYNVSAVYICRDYTGAPAADGHETLDVRFFPTDALPEALSKPDLPAIRWYLEHQ